MNSLTWLKGGFIQTVSPATSSFRKDLAVEQKRGQWAFRPSGSQAASKVNCTFKRDWMSAK
jgi:hypothetical protein